MADSDHSEAAIARGAGVTPTEARWTDCVRVMGQELKTPLTDQLFLPF